MVEYQNWYQVLQPIGSFTNERSRVEILKLADESDLRLRDKIRLMPFGFKRECSEETLGGPFSPETLSDKSSEDVFQNFKEISMSKNFKKRPESGTYLSPKLKNFQDQEKEIKAIFWNLLKTIDPECSADIDVEAIRDFLKKRQEQLGREEKEKSDIDMFDKYGLGIHARKLAGTTAEDLGAARRRGTDSLMAMIDKMVEERTKPIPQGKDMYDKNNPITGKVGFRRGEINGPREFTDLDEKLDFGDSDKDVNFNKFLVAKGRGRFDSKGNFIPNESEKDRKKRMGKSDTQKKGRKKKGGDGDSESSEDVLSKRGKKGKSKKEGRPRSASEMKRYLDDLKKSRRYPEWDFPMCNYPKWVHRMYRMDQEKIGQLIKQGMDVPEYCPPWMMQVLDNVWGAKDVTKRGEKPSKLRGRKLGGRASGSGSGAGKGKKKTKGDEGGKSQKDGEGKKSGEDGRKSENAPEMYEDADRRVDISGLEKGGSKTSFGMGDFLEGYENEMLDLAKLEADSDYGFKHRPDDSFDINDMIAEYENQLQQEENLLRGAEQKAKHQMEEKMRKMNERKEAAKKKIEDKNKKRLQDERIAFENEQLKLEKKQEQSEKFKITGRSTGDIGPLGKRRGKTRKWKKVVAAAEPCTEFKTWPGDPSKDEQCMKRFKVLLQGRNKVMKENEFIEIVKRISLFEYKKASPPKTPCERVKLPIC